MSTPDWLESGTEDKTQQDPPSSLNDFAPSIEPSAAAADSDHGGRSRRCSHNSPCLKYTHWTVSGILWILFVVSAALQGNDGDAAFLWRIFYILHAVTVALFVALICMRCHQKVALGWGAAMTVFSLVLMTVSAVRVANAVKSDDGDDAGGLDDRQEKANEVAGAVLGLFSAVYHVSLQYFCCQTEES